MSPPADLIPHQVIAAVKRRDFTALTPLLHPYLHWTCADGQTIHGRKNVLAHLATTPVAKLPGQYELRDGQIYRWAEP